MIKLSNKEEVKKQITNQNNLIEKYINKQVPLSNELISSINIFTEDIFNEFVKYIAQIKKNLELFDNLNSKLEKLKLEKNKDIRKELITDYINSLSSIIPDMINTNLQVKAFIEKNKTISDSTNVPEEIKKQNNDNLLENTLIISELSGKVVLPYTINKLNKIKEQNTDYENIYEIIEKEFTIPLSHYKYAPISRFKEGMQLALKRSNLNYLKALSLGAELLVNYNLHPAIITACKNIDELDVYLSCLEDDKLDKFNLFDIKFEMLPQASKNKTIVQNS